MKDRVAIREDCDRIAEHRRESYPQALPHPLLCLIFHGNTYSHQITTLYVILEKAWVCVLRQPRSLFTRRLVAKQLHEI
jgi:hypothetical protein